MPKIKQFFVTARYPIVTLFQFDIALVRGFRFSPTPAILCDPVKACDMTLSVRNLAIIVLGAPVVWALIATLIDAPALQDSGGWYALFGNFLASWGTIMTVGILAIIATIMAVALPLGLLAMVRVGWARGIITAFECRVLANKTMFETEGYRATEQDRPMWEDVFSGKLSWKASPLDNICTIVQLGAVPIAATLILIILRMLN